MTQSEMKELRDYLDGKFDAVDSRFEAMDTRFDGVDRRFDRVEATMEQEFGAITMQFVELRGYIDDAYERTNTRMDVQFDALRADLRIIRKEG